MTFEMSFEADFGSRLRVARRRAGMTQTELATAIGSTTACVCNYELANRMPNVRRARMIADALGITLDELVPPCEATVIGSVPGQTDIYDILGEEAE